jgi:hypothetical protein
VRRQLARTADSLQAADNAMRHRMSRAKGGPMVVSLDGAHIRAAPGLQVRHFEVTVGRADTENAPRTTLRRRARPAGNQGGRDWQRSPGKAAVYS